MKRNLMQRQILKSISKCRKTLIPSGMTPLCLENYMKVSIGSRIVEGPWGGGNLFCNKFKRLSY